MVMEDGVKLGWAAARFSVSLKTAAKSGARYRQFGAAGLADRSSHPHHCPRQTGSLLVEKVVAFRRGHMPGYEIARRTGLSPATVSRILRRARLSRWRDLNPPPPIQRYEHPRPGDLLHLDIKGMTRFGQVSLRGDGRLSGKRSHPGFLACAWRLTTTPAWLSPRCCPTRKRKPPLPSSTRPWSSLPPTASPVRALLTDNGSSYRSRQFRHACQQMAIQHRRPRPYTPRTNGKAERFIQTALRE